MNLTPMLKKNVPLTHARNIEDSRPKQRVVKDAKIGQLSLLILIATNQLKSLNLMISQPTIAEIHKRVPEPQSGAIPLTQTPDGNTVSHLLVKTSKSAKIRAAVTTVESNLLLRMDTHARNGILKSHMSTNSPQRSTKCLKVTIAETQTQQKIRQFGAIPQTQKLGGNGAYQLDPKNQLNHQPQLKLKHQVVVVNLNQLKKHLNQLLVHLNYLLKDTV